MTMGLQAKVIACKNRVSIIIMDLGSRDICENVAKALGLISAYGIANPDEASDYLDENIDIKKISWDVLSNIEKSSSLFEPEIDIVLMKLLADSGWEFVYSPSY